jgi:hypothetical protein
VVQPAQLLLPAVLHHAELRLLEVFERRLPVPVRLAGPVPVEQLLVPIWVAWFLVWLPWLLVRVARLFRSLNRFTGEGAVIADIRPSTSTGPGLLHYGWPGLFSLLHATGMGPAWDRTAPTGRVNQSMPRAA